MKEKVEKVDYEKYNEEWGKAKTPQALIAVYSKYGHAGVGKFLKDFASEHNFEESEEGMKRFINEVNKQYDEYEKDEAKTRFRTWTAGSIGKELKTIQFDLKGSTFEINISPYNDGWCYAGDCNLVHGIDLNFKFNTYADDKFLDLDLDDGSIITVPYKYI